MCCSHWHLLLSISYTHMLCVCSGSHSHTTWLPVCNICIYLWVWYCHFQWVLLIKSVLWCPVLRFVSGNVVLLIQAFRKKFIIPEFDVFTQKIDEIYNIVQKQTDGKVGVIVVYSLIRKMHFITYRFYKDLSGNNTICSHICVFSLHSVIYTISSLTPLYPLSAFYRLQTAFLNWPSSVQTCGVCLCVQWMARGEINTFVLH